jgi:hypothetical protein
MTCEEFRKVVDEALEKIVTTAEQRLNRIFPRYYCLSGFGIKAVCP